MNNNQSEPPPPPPPLTEDEREGTITEETFRTAIGKLSELAVKGVPGTLHSVRSLRNRELQRTAPRNGLSKAKEETAEQHQDRAVAVVADRLSGTINDDFRAAMLSMTAVGVPLAIAQPVWLRLRRSALIAELLGHDAEARQGDVIGAAFVVYTGGAGAERAIQLVWTLYCGCNGLARYLPMGAVTAGLADTEGQAAARVVAGFQEGRRAPPPAEWQVALDKVSFGYSVQAAGIAAAAAVRSAGSKAAPHLERLSTATTSKAEDVAAGGLATVHLGASKVMGMFGR